MYLHIVYRKTLQVIEEDPDIGHLDKVPFFVRHHDLKKGKLIFDYA